MSSSKTRPAQKAVAGKAGRSGVGEAGRSGEDVRSDLYARFEWRPSGGVEVEIDSRVEVYYGASIREQAHAALASLGVRDGRLYLKDGGALPFVLDARIEAAVLQSRSHEMAAGSATPGGGRARESEPGFHRPGWPRYRVVARRACPRDRLRRSRLYLPGSEPKYMINAGLHRPDAIILDLEDSVHVSEKFGARILCRHALRAIDFGDAERMVRINQLPMGLSDVDEVVCSDPDLILIPKVEVAEQVAEVDARIQSAQSARGSEHPIWLMPILESARGIENAYAIAQASPRTVALTLGLEDYTADLGVGKTREGSESFFARSRVVNAARAAGLQAIDSVYGDVDDLTGLREWGLRSRAIGFVGMGCVHPRQIPVIHEAFSPTKEEIAKALRIVEAYESAQKQKLGVVSLGSKMIDPPVVARALALVERARATGRIERSTGEPGAEG